MTSRIKIKTTIDEEQRRKFLRTLKYIAWLLACGGVFLIFPLRLCDSWLRWPIFIIISFVAVTLISKYIEAYSKEIVEKRVGIGIILFVFIFVLGMKTSTYRTEKGYERKGVTVDAEIIHINTVHFRYLKGYELEYAFSVDGKEYNRTSPISKYDYERLERGMTIPIIYHSRYPKVSRPAD